MTHIFERVLLKCPYAQARRRMHEQASSLVPELSPFALHVEHADDPLRFDERLYVEWSPKEGALLPTFKGELVLSAEASLASPVLELRGDYAPPLGVPGKAFDLIIGSKVAAATARTLLRKMADRIERDAAA